MEKRNRHTAEIKAKVVLELLSEESTLNQSAATARSQQKSFAVSAVVFTAPRSGVQKPSTGARYGGAMRSIKAIFPGMQKE